MSRRRRAGLFRLIIAFVAAVIVMAVAGTIAQTQFVIAALIAIGAPVTIADRIMMTGADLVGFAPLYGVIIAAGFLIAFPAAAFVQNRLGLSRLLVFSLAGAAANAAILLLTREVFFGVPFIAGARSTSGLLVQIGCGTLAGTVYAALTPGPRARAP